MDVLLAEQNNEVVVKIVFLLPDSASKPVGGVKVVLEYANRLAVDGMEVSIVYATFNRWLKSDPVHRFYFYLRYLKEKFTGSFLPKWFPMDSRIHQQLVWCLDHYHYSPDARIVATAVDTSFYLNQYNIPDSHKFYFIQGYENWFVSDDFLRSTYCYPMHKIVIARWLQRKVERCGEQADFVPNGFDFDFFQYSLPVEKRDKYRIVSMFHVDKRKGLDVAFKAFEIVWKHYPQLHVDLFSVYNKPDNLPSWYSFHHKPDQVDFNALYNHAAIYVGASNTEGWGLTVGEAMQCGCAVACTDNLGYLEMAKDGETALVSKVGDAQALASNIIRLIEDDALRYRIAENGNHFIQQFDIEKSYLKFKKILLS